MLSIKDRHIGSRTKEEKGKVGRITPMEKWIHLKVAIFKQKVRGRTLKNDQNDGGNVLKLLKVNVGQQEVNFLPKIATDIKIIVNFPPKGWEQLSSGIKGQPGLKDIDIGQEIHRLNRETK